MSLSAVCAVGNFFFIKKQEKSNPLLIVTRQTEQVADKSIRCLKNALHIRGAYKNAGVSQICNGAAGLKIREDEPEAISTIDVRDLSRFAVAHFCDEAKVQCLRTGPRSYINHMTTDGMRERN